ncbi:MAG: hypothetical protein IPF67_16595 [Saprospiraceae bacterium]|nr:hypothetical protein [Candidatus Brachybacter algidus]
MAAPSRLYKGKSGKEHGSGQRNVRLISSEYLKQNLEDTIDFTGSFLPKLLIASYQIK